MYKNFVINLNLFLLALAGALISPATSHAHLFGNGVSAKVWLWKDAFQFQWGASPHSSQRLVLVKYSKDKRWVESFEIVEADLSGNESFIVTLPEAIFDIFDVIENLDEKEILAINFMDQRKRTYQHHEIPDTSDSVFLDLKHGEAQAIERIANQNGKDLYQLKLLVRQLRLAAIKQPPPNINGPCSEILL